MAPNKKNHKQKNSDLSIIKVDLKKKPHLFFLPNYFELEETEEIISPIKEEVIYCEQKTYSYICKKCFLPKKFTKQDPSEITLSQRDPYFSCKCEDFLNILTKSFQEL